VVLSANAVYASYNRPAARLVRFRRSPVAMWTNQPIYFALLVLAALLWIKFGPYPLLIIAAALILLSLWSRLTRPRAWKGNGYAVRVEHGFREEAWVNYEEAGRTLSLRSVWANQRKLELSVEIDEPLYFPPDYSNPLPDSRIQEIEGRVSDGLEHMKIRHSFVRTRPTSA
jgi:hypothetical protein